MLHLVDGFLPLVSGNPMHPPVLEHLCVEKVLIDRRELVSQYLVEVNDDVAVDGLHEVVLNGFESETMRERVRLIKAGSP